MTGNVVATLMFTDLVGSTELSQRLGDDAAEALRRRHFRMLRECITAHDGAEVKPTGDGVMVAFGSASDAVSCAVAMQRAVARGNRRLEDPLSIRIGVNAGEVIPAENDYFGTPVVVAERLCGAAGGAQVLVSDVIRALVGSRAPFAFRDVGPQILKGILEPVPAYEVEWEPDVADDLPAGFPDVDRAAFVGRDTERQTLRTVWKLARTGSREVAVVAGEPGIGKTRLVTELALDALQDGATVLYGRCDEEPGAAYQPFVEVLRDLVARSAAEDLEEHVRVHGGEIGRLAPALGSRVPGTPPPPVAFVDPNADRESERARLFDAVADAISLAARSAPVLLVLDDLQWASKPTALLLRHVVRVCAGTPLCVVLAYRDTDVDRAHPLSDVLADLRRELTVERLVLTGLDEEAVAALAGSAGVAADVHRRTEGNPFFVTELLRHLEDSDELPAGVREVVARRIARLSSAAQDALRVASVVGETFEFAVLENICGDVLDVLDEAVHAHVLDEASATAYRFAHALVRETLYEGVADRAAVHGRVATAIEDVYASRLDDHLAALAYHFAAASHSLKAGTYADAAAAQALAAAAYDEAAAFAERGLMAIDDDQPALEALLWNKIAAARWWDLDPAIVQEASRKAANAARAAGSAEQLGWAAYWFALLAVYNPDEAFELCEEALRELGETFPALRALVLSMMIWAGNFAGRRLERDRLTGDALRLARRTRDADTIGGAAFVRAFNLREAVGEDAISYEERSSLIDELIELGAENPLHAAQGYRLRLSHRLTLGDVAGCRADAAELTRLARVLRSEMYEAVARGVDPTVDAMLGRFDAVDAFQAANVGRWGAHPYYLLIYAVRLGWIRHEQGRFDEAMAIQASQVQLLPKLAGWRGALALTQANAGLLDEARASVDVLASDDFGTVRWGSGGLTAWAFVVEAECLAGDTRYASFLYELGSSHAGTLIVFGDPWVVIGAADRYLGMLAALGGRGDDALEHFRAAAALEERAGAPSLLARTQYWWAQSDPSRAHDLLDTAGKAASALGMDDLERKISALS